MPATNQIAQDHWGIGLNAVADAFAGADVRSDIVSMRGYAGIQFIVHWGVGVTGTTTLQVKASDDASASNVTAIPFRYKRITSPDTNGTETAVAATGLLTTAGSNQIYVIEVNADDVFATGYSFVLLEADEGTDSPLLGGILYRMHTPRYANQATQIATA